MLGSVGPDIELAVQGRLRQQVDIGNQGFYRVDAHIEVVLDLIEIPMIGIGDLRRDIALGYPVHILRCHVQRPDHRVQRLVDSGYQLTPAAFKGRRIAPGVELAVLGGLDQMIRLRI